MATISYYDNVKDNVKNGKSNGSSFDTLKKAAQEHSEDEESNEGDGTSIEVLEDGLQQKQTSQQMQSSSSNETSSNPLTSSDAGSTEHSSSDVSADMTGVEEKLDTIIEQNQRMIEILESFGE